MLRLRDPAFAALLALSATAIACASVLFAVPRAVPLTLPVLWLDSREVRAQLDQDATHAARPLSALGRAFDQTLLEIGRSEFRQLPALAVAAARTIPALKQRAARELDEAGLNVLRAHATERFMRALAERLADEDEEQGAVGAQYSFLLQHGYVTPDGALLAPALSVRATYKVRWNMIFGYAPSAGLSRIERLAYEGFRALEARAVSDDVRHAALRELLLLDPSPRMREAAMIWQAQAGSPGALLRYVDSDAGRSASLRLRNMARSVVPAAAPI